MRGRALARLQMGLRTFLSTLLPAMLALTCSARQIAFEATTKHTAAIGIMLQGTATGLITNRALLTYKRVQMMILPPHPVPPLGQRIGPISAPMACASNLATPAQRATTAQRSRRARLHPVARAQRARLAQAAHPRAQTARRAFTLERVPPRARLAPRARIAPRAPPSAPPRALRVPF